MRITSKTDLKMYRATNNRNVTRYDEEKKGSPPTQAIPKILTRCNLPTLLTIVSAFAQMESSFYYTYNTKDPFIVAPYKC